MHWTIEDIKKANRIERLNVINGLTGIKPANLIGSISSNGHENLAIFSSVVHLGSNPAILGFIIRPSTDVPRNTYENILESGFYTINHVHASSVEKAHFTSAKFPKDISEFEKCGLNPEYKNNFKAPFVKESTVKIGMRFIEEIPIPINGTSLIIGEIEHIFIPDEYMEEGGHINLESSSNTGVSGLNSYYKLQKTRQFPYARASELPAFDQ